MNDVFKDHADYRRVRLGGSLKECASPSLKMGTTKVFFQSDGTSPVLRKYWYSLVKFDAGWNRIMDCRFVGLEV